VKGARATQSLLSKANAKQATFHKLDSSKVAIEKQMQKNGTTLAQFHAKQKYRPLIVVGPSGVGKGTVIKKLTEESFPNRFGFSVSYTTRGPRPGEEDGTHYNFVNVETFE